MDFSDSLKVKKYFRFTGPPENWLTAIKYKTWGMELKHQDKWEQIQPGDVIFLHSTGNGTSSFRNAKSGIIGLALVGPNFSTKNNYLWMEEMRESNNKWPLLVPFEEVYLFSDIPNLDLWDAPNIENGAQTEKIIDALLKNFIPLSKIPGFPHMGSFSTVSQAVADQILFGNHALYLHTEGVKKNSLDISQQKSTKLTPVRNVSETMRYADTLRVFSSINRRIVNGSVSHFERDNELLARAENSHATMLEYLIEIFRQRGYETRSNRFIDLFAFNLEKRKSFLFEVKSTEGNNFRAQARKGIVQLYEYDYFEVRKFINDEKITLSEQHKVLALSQEPQDTNYVNFINQLSIDVGVVKSQEIIPIGKDSGFSTSKL